jgi:hypothetical protein
MGKQEYILLQCHSCSTYQVHIDKKSRSFGCSICHIKQPFSRIFARSGKARDLRTLCSRYNREAPGGLNADCDVEETKSGCEDEEHKHLSEGDVEERNLQESSFSGWDAYLCEEEENDLNVSGGSGHRSCITDASRQLEDKESRWKQDDGVTCRDDQQPLKKRRRRQTNAKQLVLGSLGSCVDSARATSCIETTKFNETIKPTLRSSLGERHQDPAGDGQGHSAWFAEFLEEDAEPQ